MDLCDDAGSNKQQTALLLDAERAHVSPLGGTGVAQTTARKP